MNPGRREQGEDRTLEGWDTWIDRAIRAAQQRGDFDDLPSAGKPLRIYSNPFAPEWDAASGLLKDAGVAPFWVELDKEILAEFAALAETRERIRQRLAAHVVRPRDEGVTGDPASQQARFRWWPFRRSARAKRPNQEVPARDESADLEAWRERARRDYLDRAARLDAKIAEYHNALPGDLWWLQKPRLSTESAAREFDETCPPLQSASWREGGGSSVAQPSEPESAR